MSFAMSVPALRRPKFINTQLEEMKTSISQSDFVILTLRNENKLVVSSDAYHGILTLEMEFKCVFCTMAIELDCNHKEKHIKSAKHLSKMNEYPFLEGFCQNLIKQLNRECLYCTICNVTVAAPFLKRHITSEVHIQELEKAATRALSYKPSG